MVGLPYIISKFYDFFKISQTLVLTICLKLLILSNICWANIEIVDLQRLYQGVMEVQEGEELVDMALV